MADAQRFLVKMLSPAGSLALAPSSPGQLGLNGSSVPLQITPLFASVGKSAATLGAAAPSQWYVVDAPIGLDAGNPWDVCHQMLTGGLGLAGGPQVEFAEPDFKQSWESIPPDVQGVALTAACEATLQADNYPSLPGDNFWYQDNAHGQFQSALQRVTAIQNGATIRVAHLDTGYDPNHKSVPAHLRKDLERNFVDADRPNDATDDSSGALNNLGHGTGTLSILAGSPCAGLARLGVAPFVEVVPIRVASRVEIFYTSAIAKAFDYVHSLCDDPSNSVDVITMSMGGLASQAWAEAVNALYDAGVVVVTAAGNNYRDLPTRNIVFPARFNRVIAACGIMEDTTPFAELSGGRMAGNYGPDSKMRTAVSGWTPNVPWARFGCENVVRFDGTGTSAATPQVAATAAMWLRGHKGDCSAYPSAWMKAEATRQAIFTSARASEQYRSKTGNGAVQANAAIDVKTPSFGDLKAEDRDSASFGFLRVLTGFGIAGAETAPGTPRRRMLELEALQLSQSKEIEALLPDPSVDPATLSFAQSAAIATALANHPSASTALRQVLQASALPSHASAKPSGQSSMMDDFHLHQAMDPPVSLPPSRRLRVYSHDPTAGRSLDTFRINEATLHVRWEQDLKPGPVGEYLEVIDIDPASNCCYAPVDLNDARLLATDGLKPSESNPQFHQQMVYAVAMKTIEYFEHALGRVALWASNFATMPVQRKSGKSVQVTETYVQRLRIYPHAMRMANSFYSPPHKAVLFGYFSGGDGKSAAQDQVFCALSHDIGGHEVTHALLDGLHSRFREPTNPDVLAFHEAFADIVALFQHFTIEESLREQIAAARGDLNQETLLSKIAVQFGNVLQHHGALRDYIGGDTVDKDTGKKTWARTEPDVTDYQKNTEAHDRGKVLVAAVFDAFLRIYSRLALEPIRLATNGSEVLLPGALPGPLVDALTVVASKVARHVLTMCIRALDYCPPVDITFGDYLRAVITADHDLVPNDRYGYRIAFVSAFAARGIFPQGVKSPSVETMVWEPPPAPLTRLHNVLGKIDLRWDLQSSRHDAWHFARDNAKKFHDWLISPKHISDAELSMLGLKRHANPHYTLITGNGSNIDCDLRGIEVHSVRPLRRIGPDGQFLSQLVVEVTQSLHANDGSGHVFRGGATLIIDLTRLEVSYLVRKRFDTTSRISQQTALRASQESSSVDVYNSIASSQSEPFAVLHSAGPYQPRCC